MFPDGSWRVGDLHVIHPPSLRYFKAHLVHEESGDYVVEGDQRMPVDVQGPAFHVVSAGARPRGRGEARAVLDDGSVEKVGDHALGMNRETGRFECRVRGGDFRALLVRGPHQVLMEHLEEEGGRFYLRVGHAADRRADVTPAARRPRARQPAASPGARRGQWRWAPPPCRSSRATRCSGAQARPRRRRGARLPRGRRARAAWARCSRTRSYLVNLAADQPGVPGPEPRHAGGGGARAATRLGIPHVVVHPGAHMGAGEAAGLRAVAESLDDGARPHARPRTSPSCSR